jgi:putative transposase
LKAARLLAREHNRIANIRRSILHEVSSQLAKTHSRLAVGDLPVANLIRNKRLAQAVTDAAWAESPPASVQDRLARGRTGGL